jgi:hypothetical protein
MVAINKILLPGCTGEGCGGETGTCTDSRVHRRNAENRVPATRNHRSTVALNRWLARDPIGYRGGINLYGYVAGQPAGRTDPTGRVGRGECIFFCRVKFLLCAYLLTEDTVGVGFIYCVILFSQCERRCPPARRHPGACSHLHGLGGLYSSPYTYYP